MSKLLDYENPAPLNTKNLCSRKTYPNNYGFEIFYGSNCCIGEWVGEGRRIFDQIKNSLRTKFEWLKVILSFHLKK